LKFYRYECDSDRWMSISRYVACSSESREVHNFYETSSFVRVSYGIWYCRWLTFHAGRGRSQLPGEGGLNRGAEQAGCCHVNEASSSRWDDVLARQIRTSPVGGMSASIPCDCGSEDLENLLGSRPCLHLELHYGGRPCSDQSSDAKQIKVLTYLLISILVVCAYGYYGSA